MLNSKKIGPNKEDFENKVLIEKWMKRNSSSSVTIGQDTVKTKLDVKIPKEEISSNNTKSVSKTKILKSSQGNGAATYIKRKSNSMIIKRINISSDESEQSAKKQKIFRQSLPAISTELPSISKTLVKIANRKSDSDLKYATIVKKVSKNVSTSLEQVKHSPNNTKATIEHALSDPLRLSNAPEIPSIATGIKSMENNGNSNNSIKQILCKDKDTDVYTSLLENYRYLITPKSWSVTEFMSETKERYVVFFNAHVVKENNILISVMRKSLIIDKGSTMNYSVHGLPVDLVGTILPRILDNTKKLLSILHIFDKMQVCEGLGSDLNVMQTDFVFKDNCRYWRHKDCKIVLIKAKRCPICTEARNRLLKRKIFRRDSSRDSVEII